MTLTEFLLARFDEDEGLAKIIKSNQALATVEAHRRIVEHESYDRPKLGAPPYNGPLNDPATGGRHPQLRAYIAEHGERVTDSAILRILATPYAGHPDYRQEWRP